MSWGSYHQGPTSPEEPPPHGYRGRPTREPDRGYEPSGYVTNDPYATPSYNQQSGAYAPPYQPNGSGYPGQGRFSYDHAHPPRPAVGPVTALKLFFKNYAVFHGRASRSEYWWMWLWSAIFAVAYFIPLGVAIGIEGNSTVPVATLVLLGILGIVGLGLLLPMISLQVRRLHDAGFSGFFTIFAYVPYLNSLGWLVPVIMSFFPSTPAGIKYDNPAGTHPADH